MEIKAQSRDKRLSALLIAMCWAVYAASYVAKLNYAANINRVMSYYSVSHAEAGLVSTFFFFAYGIGQVVNGFFCKKYNIKLTVLFGLIVSTATNILIATVDNFDMIKYLWALNGFALSVLWPCLIRLLSEILPNKYMARASVIMGTTTATGTFFIYGMSALLAEIAGFKVIFFIAAGVTVASIVFWLISYSLIIGRGAEKTAQSSANADTAEAEMPRSCPKMTGAVLTTVILLCFVGVATNFVKDGLTTWVPSILKESFGLGDSLSIVLTLSLPVLSIFGNLFAVTLHKRIPNFVYQCGAVFFASGIVIGLAMGSFGLDTFLPALISFAVICFLVGSCNSLITSIFPLFMKDKLNSGLIAGIINGFCYVGSTLSSWGLGLIADNFGWMGVFILLLAVSLTVALAALVFGIYGKLKKIKSED